MHPRKKAGLSSRTREGLASVLVSLSALPPPAAPDGVVLLCVVRAVLKKIHQRILVGDFVRVARIDWPSRPPGTHPHLGAQVCGRMYASM